MYDSPIRETTHMHPMLTKDLGLQKAYLQKTNLLPVLPAVLSCFRAADPMFNSQKQNLLRTQINTNLKFNVP